MHPQHIRKIELRNFKRFSKLTIENTGLINLIVGDNNVGKTSVLEALFIRDSLMLKDQNVFCKEYFTGLNYILHFYKKFKNFRGQALDFFCNNLDNTRETAIYLEKFAAPVFSFRMWPEVYNPDWKLELSVDGQTYTFSYNNSKMAPDPFNIVDQSPYSFYNPYYIPYFLGYNYDLTDYYARHIQQDSELKDNFIESLRVILPAINDILIDTVTAHNPILLIHQKGYKRNMPLATFGDGFANLFRLMIEIYKNEGRRIMIDEIDYGVHYGRKTDFWKVIAHAAQTNKVQIFATTHNNECISSLQQAGSDAQYNFGKDIRIIRLAEINDKQVKSYTYDYDEFSNAIENENELR